MSIKKIPLKNEMVLREEKVPTLQYLTLKNGINHFSLKCMKTSNYIAKVSNGSKKGYKKNLDSKSELQTYFFHQCLPKQNCYRVKKDIRKLGQKS